MLGNMDISFVTTCYGLIAPYFNNLVHSAQQHGFYIQWEWRKYFPQDLEVDTKERLKTELKKILLLYFYSCSSMIEININATIVQYLKKYTQIFSQLLSMFPNWPKLIYCRFKIYLMFHCFNDPVFREAKSSVFILYICKQRLELHDLTCIWLWQTVCMCGFFSTVRVSCAENIHVQWSWAKLYSTNALLKPPAGP